MYIYIYIISTYLYYISTVFYSVVWISEISRGFMTEARLLEGHEALHHRATWMTCCDLDPQGVVQQGVHKYTPIYDLISGWC